MKKRIMMLALVSALGLVTGCQKEVNERDPENNGKQEAVAEEHNDVKDSGAGEDSYEEEDIKGKKTEKNSESASEYREIVMDGVLLNIPSDNDVRIDNEENTIYVDDANLDYISCMIIRNESYEESTKDKDRMKSKAMNYDITLLQDVTEYICDGKSYTYYTFKYNDSGDVTSVVVTGATDSKAIAANVLVNSDLSIEEVIDLMNVYLSTAEATEREDTDSDDLIAENALGNNSYIDPIGERVESIDMNLNTTEVTAMVPEGFYYDSSYDYQDEILNAMCSKRFSSEDGTDVNVYLYDEDMYDDINDVANGYFISDEDYPEFEDSGVQIEEYKGNRIAFRNISYLYNDIVFNKAVAVCQLSDNTYYAVDAINLYEVEITFDKIKGFMDIREK